MAILDIDRAGKVFGSGEVRVTALDDVSLSAEPREFVAIMGPSGSGKSTLLHLAGGLDRPTSGRVLLGGRDLAGLNAAGLAHALRRQMSSGQVMYYFTSKEHILLETLAWQEHQDTGRRRAVLAKVTGAWRQLERYIGLYLPASPADPVWILWMEAWARAPHSQAVSQFMEDLLLPWRDDLGAIIDRGVQEGAFAAPADIGDFTIRFIALLDGLALQGLRQLHNLSRKRLTELAMHAARAELARDAATAPAG